MYSEHLLYVQFAFCSGGYFSLESHIYIGYVQAPREASFFYHTSEGMLPEFNWWSVLHMFCKLYHLFFNHLFSRSIFIFFSFYLCVCAVFSQLQLAPCLSSSMEGLKIIEVRIVMGNHFAAVRKSKQQLLRLICVNLFCWHTSSVCKYYHSQISPDSIKFLITLSTYSG